MNKMWQVPNWLETFKVQSSRKGGKFLDETKHQKMGTVFVVGGDDAESVRRHVHRFLEANAFKRDVESLKAKSNDLLHFSSDKGQFWILPPKRKTKTQTHNGHFDETSYALYRDTAGSLASVAKSLQVTDWIIEFVDVGNEVQLGFLSGLGIWAYQFRPVFESTKSFDGFPQVYILDRGSKVAEVLAKSIKISKAVNIARHLVNLPANCLNPKTFADYAKNYFSKSKKLKVEVWDASRLEKEGMGLHLAVGRGAEFGPCLVHISYRPKGQKGKAIPPVAFVGKGVTFDTGGNDIKPSSGMRLMKKDMGGAAAVLALSTLVESLDLARPYDFYLALAENSVDAKSFRPGDIFISRSGVSVEISNTDAEGRLVLADAMDVAVTQSQKPLCVVDLATLTGAIKVALGADVAGLFANHDELADVLIESGKSYGELSWRMPLVAKYTSQLTSPVAQLQNSAEGGFGGAITAALFLEKFSGGIPWAHVDIYSWNDKAGGPFSFSGGSGQGVQMMIGFLEYLEKHPELRFD